MSSTPPIHYNRVREWGCSNPAVGIYTAFSVALIIIGGMALAGTFFPGVNVLSTLGSTFGTVGSYVILGSGIALLFLTILGKCVDLYFRNRDLKKFMYEYQFTPIPDDSKSLNQPPLRTNSGTGAGRNSGDSEHIYFT